MATFGVETNLVAGTLTLVLPAGTRYWWIQNQDSVPLKIAFSSSSGFGPYILEAAVATGAPGGEKNSIGFPFFGVSVTLTSSIATHQFGSGATQARPRNLHGGGQ